MKWQVGVGLVLSLSLMVLGTTPGAARGLKPPEDEGVTGATKTAPASAPWFFNTVDSDYDVGQHVSVALDPENGTPHVSYYDASHKDLRVAKYVGSGGNCGPNSGWYCETVDSGGDVGKYSSIAVDPTDNLPMIAYYDATNGALKLAIGYAFGWMIKTIDEPLLASAGLHTSLELGSPTKPRIAYYVSNVMGADSLWYAEYVGEGTGNCGGNDYQCDPIDSGDRVGKYASLALDGSDQAHVAYYDGGSDALMYAHQDGGGWTVREILPTNSGQHASLTVDVENGDRPHIAHYDGSNGTLEYAVYVGSGGNCGFDSSSTQFEWQCDEIEFVGTSTHPKGVSLAVADTPIIAYQSGDSVLKVARPAAALGLLVGDCGPQDLFYTWQCETIRFGIGISQGDFMSLAVNSTGLGTLAYYGGTGFSDGDLRVATQRLQVFLPVTSKDW